MRVPELLEQALRALPGDATKREIGLVAKTLLESGDEETLTLLENHDDDEVREALNRRRRRSGRLSSSSSS